MKTDDPEDHITSSVMSCVRNGLLKFKLHSGGAPVKMLSVVPGKFNSEKRWMVPFSIFFIMLAALFCAGPVSAGASIQDLWSDGEAYAITADGKTAVGYKKHYDSDSRWHPHAVYWTESGGAVDIGPDSKDSYAYGVSSDGSIIVGDCNDSAFRWTASTGMVDIGGSATESYSKAISADGSTIVGYFLSSTDSTHYHAFYRTETSGGLVDIGTSGVYSYAYGVSSNGSVIVGESSDKPFRWTATTGIVSLGTLGGSGASGAYGVSPDGNVVVGYSYLSTDANYSRAFRWTESSGMVDLGRVDDNVVRYNHVATAVSSDGNVVVGMCRDNSNYSQRAFRWTASGGIQTVYDWLVANGTTTSGSISSANGVSSDGNTVVGEWTGQNAYIAKITQEYTLTVTNGNKTYGTITSADGGINCGTTCSATYDSGSSVTLTATANSGYVFIGWSGSCSGTGTCAVTMSEARSVTAVFTTLPTSCIYTISPAAKSLKYKGGSVNVTVKAKGATSCDAPSIVNGTSWITTSTSFSKNKGTVKVSASALGLSAARSASITIGGKNFTLTQSGVTCTIAISPASASFSASASTGSFTVTPNATDCAWTAYSTASKWLTISSGSGTGTGTVGYALTSNTTKKVRTGKIKVTATASKKNKVYTVKQGKQT